MGQGAHWTSSRPSSHVAHANRLVKMRTLKCRMCHRADMKMSSAQSGVGKVI